jgi:hypothetical protein
VRYWRMVTRNDAPLKPIENCVLGNVHSIWWYWTESWGRRWTGEVFLWLPGRRMLRMQKMLGLCHVLIPRWYKKGILESLWWSEEFCGRDTTFDRKTISSITLLAWKLPSCAGHRALLELYESP